MSVYFFCPCDTVLLLKRANDGPNMKLLATSTGKEGRQNVGRTLCGLVTVTMAEKSMTSYDFIPCQTCTYSNAAMPTILHYQLSDSGCTPRE